MPTTKLKNAVYRTLLPFCAPGCGSQPVTCINGHPVMRLHSFERLIRIHHVLGSVTLLESKGQTCLICTSSAAPLHIAQPDTYFRVASLTKTATAVLVMHLADCGMLALDIPLSVYLPSADCLKGVTIRHLLSHTSGIIDPPDLESMLVKGIPFPDLFPRYLRFPPGDTFHYSNLGFGLIGCVLEAVFDLPVGVIFRDFLFHPLQMNATLEGCLLSECRIMPVTRILPYRRGEDLILTVLGSAPLLHPDPLRHYGHTAGSMYSDAVSLKQLLHIIMHNESGYLSDNARNDMKRRHSSYGRLSPTLSYGLGMLRINDRTLSEGTVYGHQGFAYGCADGAFFEEKTDRILITLNGGCSEARSGRFGLANLDLCRWVFRKELPEWK